jgi:hypothetical protein
MHFPRSVLAIGLAVQLGAIGTVVTAGAFRLNHATVRSNATLFEGAQIETGIALARMDLASGTRLELEPESAERFLDGLIVERVAARIDRAPGVGDPGRYRLRVNYRTEGFAEETGLHWILVEAAMLKRRAPY